ncbi:ABC transporter permease [Pseudonocardia sp. CNS-004]|nr:ABC transporter permease [Pseudonocardia sp. CNS-004]
MPGRARRRGRGTRRVLLTVGWVLLLVPAVAAVAGPLVAALLGLNTAPGGTPLQPAGAGHVLGTDVLGRDLLALLLHGGTTVVLLTLAALVLAYAVAVPAGLLVTAGGRHAGSLAVGLLDVVLAMPSLLLLMVLAATGRTGIGWLVVAVALVQLPHVVRLVRAAATVPACQAALETMTMIGEPWWRVRLVETGRRVLPPVLVDATTRVTGIVGLLSAANFLGVGLAPSIVDWAVVVDQNMTALFLRPGAVLLPAGLLVALCAGTNLLVDELLERRG